MSGVQRLDGFEIVPVVDAAGALRLEGNFAGASAQDWARARELDPAAFGAEGDWLLDFRCFVIRREDGWTALVDTGVGHAHSPAMSWAPGPGRLPDALKEAGVDPGEVDAVVLTHLHSDHYGWCVGPDGEPLFPNARHLIQQAELAALTEDLPGWDYAIEPLRAAGLIDPLDGRTELAGGRGSVALLPTPGHTPGHQSVLVSDGREEILLTGDVLVHAVQLVNPEVVYTPEVDPALARSTRIRLFEEARRSGALLGTPHLREPFIRL